MFRQKDNFTVLEIHLLHNYFYNQQGSKAFHLKASPETEAWFRKVGILIISKANSVEFRLDESKKERLVRVLQESSDRLLSFILERDEPYWLNLTDLPYNFGQEPALLYFSNQQKPQHDLLHTSEYVNSTDILSAKTASNILSDVRHLAALSTPSRELALSLQSRADLTGWLDIHLQASTFEKWLNALMSGMPFEPLRYYLQFQTRAVYWRYWFYLQNSESPDVIKSLRVVTEEPSLTFEGPEQILMPNQQVAFVFISNKPIPLYERSPFRFELFLEKKQYKHQEINFGSQKRTEIIFRLPVADPESVHPVRIENEVKLCVDMAVGI